MIRAVIVEDNVMMATVLDDLINQQNKHIQILGTAHTGSEAIHLINAKDPDLVFLDIELPDMTGFNVLQGVDEIRFRTIFTTSHKHYAIKAFRFNALDYLVKPIHEKELNEALSRFNALSDHMIIKNALTNLETKSARDQNLILPTQNGILNFPLKRITHIQGERNYSFIHLEGGKRELSSKTLAYFDEILNDKDFFRCHRSHLVNKIHIRDIKKESFRLSNDLDIPISRRKKTLAKQWYFEIMPS